MKSSNCRKHLLFLGIISCCLAVQTNTYAEDKKKQSTDTIRLTEGLIIASVGRYGRSPFYLDVIEAMRIADKWKAPKAGDTLKLSDTVTRKWSKITAGSNGWFIHQSLRGGYLYCTVNSDQDRTMLLEARGYSTLFVNNRPYPGDPYNHGLIALPVKLKKGGNEFLFHVGRGRVTAKLVKPRKAITLSRRDTTLPDLIVGEKGPFVGALMLINATDQTQSGLSILAIRKGSSAVRTNLPEIPPMTNRKVGFKILGKIDAKSSGEVEIQLVRANGKKIEVLDSRPIKLSIKTSNDLHRRTFISKIDGSVQYYSVRPAIQKVTKGAAKSSATVKPGMVLTLHGASVQGHGQAAVYAAKESLVIVAPTNRRPYGFDWEDWGRLDAMEVLSLAQQRFQTDPLRTYLTGHSMGGHGTWHLGVTYPDRFAAIGPSAGWISFWSYANRKRSTETTDMQKMLDRGTTASDTIKLGQNYGSQGIYILHGDRDTNVPVTHARTMRQYLASFHPDFVYKEQPGAGHWWGNQCCDWKPMFEFFAHHQLPNPQSVNHVKFITASPGVSHRSHWVSICAQQKQQEYSKIDLNLDRKKRLFSGKTENATRLSLDASSVQPDPKLPGTFSLDIDGTKFSNIAWPGDGEKIWLAKTENKWSLSEKPSPLLKGPHRNGSFKSVFNHKALLVYGTRGTAEENRWSLNKARYDAEHFWYRGNGSFEVIADTKFDLSSTKDRNVILYGNSDTNAAWYYLLEDSPIQVSRNLVMFGSRQFLGPKNATLFVRPRPDSDTALVGVIGGTSVSACRSTTRLPYFVSGTGYGDVVIFSSDILTQGTKAVVITGYFGNDWSIREGEFAFKK